MANVSKIDFRVIVNEPKRHSKFSHVRILARAREHTHTNRLGFCPFWLQPCVKIMNAINSESKLFLEFRFQHTHKHTFTKLSHTKQSLPLAISLSVCADCVLFAHCCGFRFSNKHDLKSHREMSLPPRDGCASENQKWEEKVKHRIVVQIEDGAWVRFYFRKIKPNTHTHIITCVQFYVLRCQSFELKGPITTAAEQNIIMVMYILFFTDATADNVAVAVVFRRRDPNDCDSHQQRQQ